ncbi:hypothetical protein HK098_005534 [Nowakowskiella sp. JEL0407]|nr:hypothetical protein HK098_005534 [Nowakowskiella sp. JEL0407]
MEQSFFNNTSEDYYQLLGIERDVDEDAIKKAYKRMALRYHPDKRGSQEPDAAETFQKIQNAYSVLSDPKKRKVYDEYGEGGVKMIDQLGDVPFEMLDKINLIFFALTIIVVLLIIFPAFVSGKADGLLNWPWLAVFVPIFIVDVFVISVLILQSNVKDTNDEHDDDEERASVTENMKKERKRQIRMISLGLVGYYVVFCVFQILIALRLEKTITTTWAVVFIPWFVMELAHFVAGTMEVVAKFKVGVFVVPDMMAGDEPMANITTRPLTTSEKYGAVISAYGFWTFRIVQAILLVLKADGTNIDWRVVFIPTYVYGVWVFVSNILKIGKLRKIDIPEKRAEKLAGIIRNFIVFIVVGVLFYVGLGLFISRLKNDEVVFDPPVSHTPTGFVIAIPLFIVLGVLFCCVCCCLPCLVFMTKSAYKAELAKNEVVIGDIPAERRIQYDLTETSASSSRTY